MFLIKPLMCENSSIFHRSPMLRRCQDEKFSLSPNSGHDRSSRPWKDWELAFQSINQTIETPDDRDKRKLSFHQWIVTKSVPSTPEPVRKSRDKDLKAPVEGQKKGKSFQEWLGDKEKAEKEQKEAQEKAAQMVVHILLHCF